MHVYLVLVDGGVEVGHDHLRVGVDVGRVRLQACRVVVVVLVVVVGGPRVVVVGVVPLRRHGRVEVRERAGGAARAALEAC